MTDDELRERIIRALEEPGTRTVDSLVDEFDADRTDVVRELGKLVAEGTAEEHEGIDNAYRLKKE